MVTLVPNLPNYNHSRLPTSVHLQSISSENLSTSILTTLPTKNGFPTTTNASFPLPNHPSKPARSPAIQYEQHLEEGKQPNKNVCPNPHDLHRTLVPFDPKLFVPLKPLQPPYPKNYDPNAKCDYHASAIGHTTERCWGLKHKMQDLMDVGLLSFEENGPNVGSNPLLSHEEH
ncbi:hypothetical protein CR513_49634, partial [Mucuna pruriens]